MLNDNDSINKITKELKENGYVHLLSLSPHIKTEEKSENFNNHWEDLAYDKNFKNYTSRWRRILRYWFFSGRFRINYNKTFIPKAHYNIDYNSGPNKLSYATNNFINDSLLHEIIDLDFKILGSQIDRDTLYSVDIDLFKVVADKGEISPTTSGPHQDGEEWIFMHFVGSNNIKPVVSEVFSDKHTNEPLFSKPMSNFLETLAINDRKLFHSAGPVIQLDIDELGYRNLLLVCISTARNQPNDEQ